MMNQGEDLIIISIGGAGARFLRSLIFQLASGLKLKRVGTIKVIIIDADKGNGNLGQPLDLITLYHAIRNELYSDVNYQGDLFHHPLEHFDSQEQVISPLDERNRTIRSIVEYDDLGDRQKGLINLLLTDDELRSDLQIGFEGRPNIGTIGLQRINVNTSRSRALNQLLGDKPDPIGLISANAPLFLVSSMFGGMGSSGMPMLLQKFARPSFANHRIGSLCFMPYYKIDNGEGTTDSKHFVPRTKIALEYYNSELRNKVDTLYYIGDDLAKSKAEIHAKGGFKQKNNAHYIEFYSTTALIHFCSSTEGPERKAIQRYLSIDDEMKADSTAYMEIHKNYQLLVFIGKYMLEHFLLNYDQPALESLSWIVHSNLGEFDSDEKKLLQDFFQHLIQYNDNELNRYSKMHIVHAEMFPKNLSSAIPFPKYKADKKWYGKEIKYDNWPIFNANVISDKNVLATKHISRLLSIFENSFRSFYKERFQ